MLLIVQASKQEVRSDCEYVFLLSGIFRAAKAVETSELRDTVGTKRDLNFETSLIIRVSDIFSSFRFSAAAACLPQNTVHSLLCKKRTREATIIIALLLRLLIIRNAPHAPHC